MISRLSSLDLSLKHYFHSGELRCYKKHEPCESQSCLFFLGWEWGRRGFITFWWTSKLSKPNEMSFYQWVAFLLKTYAVPLPILYLCSFLCLPWIVLPWEHLVDTSNTEGASRGNMLFRFPKDRVCGMCKGQFLSSLWRIFFVQTLVSPDPSVLGSQHSSHFGLDNCLL